jgi:hypothetical protein
VAVATNLKSTEHSIPLQNHESEIIEESPTGAVVTPKYGELMPRSPQQAGGTGSPDGPKTFSQDAFDPQQAGPWFTLSYFDPRSLTTWLIDFFAMLFLPE